MIVIAILAAISYVAYGSVQDRAREGVVRSDLKSAAEILSIDFVRSGGKTFPSDVNEADGGDGLPASADTRYEYTVNNSADPPKFCLTGINGMIAFYITQDGIINEGACTGHSGPVAETDGDAITDGVFIQDVTSGNCPTTRTRTVDARDNHTYWVQKLSGDKCWMLTNLAYAGGGNATRGDVRTLTIGGAMTYTSPKYYIPSGANVTTEPTSPSTSVSGAGQYGYLYNWCGAMGGQATAACSNATSPALNGSISVCPAGWRLPTGGLGGEFDALNTAINADSETTDAGLLATFLAQRAGAYYMGYSGQGSDGGYWSSSAVSADTARGLFFGNGYSDPSSGSTKEIGFSVRCVAL